jgi:uracil-DNA glycosylase
MTTHSLNLNVIHPSWDECIHQALEKMNHDYLKKLILSHEWLPGHEKIFNAFSLPLTKVNYVLFGESPYPRRESANGFAFWDASVKELWSPQGLSKRVNRATSLRNILKMLLITEGCLDQNKISQEEIAKIDKSNFVQTNEEFFTNFLNHGFLLLNATLVLQADNPRKDSQEWHPFMSVLLDCLIQKRPYSKFILLGRIANTIDQYINHIPQDKLYAEHPYNHSFITNPKVLDFFKPLHLLQKMNGEPR